MAGLGVELRLMASGDGRDGGAAQCDSMCPLSEALQRELDGLLHPLERREGGGGGAEGGDRCTPLADPARCVKACARRSRRGAGAVLTGGERRSSGARRLIRRRRILAPCGHPRCLRAP